MFDITPAGIERTQALPEPVAPPAPAPDRSIAVLPFANLSQEIENEYFSDGLSEEIRNQLARVEGLRVAARTSSFAFKGRHEDVREIGRRLNVATVLEGGVRKHADTVRIDVQLVNATDGYQIWSETFERRLDDIFKLQSEVACAVINAVRPREVVEDRPPLQPATVSFDAYNLYLLGRHHFHKRTEAALQRAVDYFEQAIERDPNYALAYSGLADAYTLLSAGYYGNMPAARAIEHALRGAARIGAGSRACRGARVAGAHSAQPGRIRGRRAIARARAGAESRLHDGARVAGSRADFAGPLPGGRSTRPRGLSARSAVAHRQYERRIRRVALRR
jgi:TolB-like protein